MTIPLTKSFVFVTSLFLCLSLLLSGLLLLALVLLASVPGQRLLEDLKNFLIHNLLIRLVLLKVQRRRGTQLGDAVLGNCYTGVSIGIISSLHSNDLPRVVRSLPTAALSLSPTNSY